METRSPSEPHRVQQRRTQGWRKPENTVSVARPSRFGNPFAVGKTYGGLVEGAPEVTIRDRAHAVEHFTLWLTGNPGGLLLARMAREQLVGRNLMCFCPLDQPCHADVLIEFANPAPVLCPECRDGKCRNCIEQAMTSNDELVPCGCPKHTDGDL